MTTLQPKVSKWKLQVQLLDLVPRASTGHWTWSSHLRTGWSHMLRVAEWLDRMSLRPGYFPKESCPTRWIFTPKGSKLAPRWSRYWTRLPFILATVTILIIADLTQAKLWNTQTVSCISFLSALFSGIHAVGVQGLPVVLQLLLAGWPGPSCLSYPFVPPSSLTTCQNFPACYRDLSVLPKIEMKNQNMGLNLNCAASQGYEQEGFVDSASFIKWQ